jgi:small-conductance mechanosensitive channel
LLCVLHMNCVLRMSRSSSSVAVLATLLAAAARDPAFGQQPAEPTGPTAPAPPGAPASLRAPQKVEVQPHADDAAIEQRLTRILRATGWFEQPQVEVDEGVVFLSGIADADEHRQWAEHLASNTQDVVAVVNKIEVPVAAAWDVGPVVEGLRQLQRDALRWLPFFLLGTIIFAVACVAGWLATRWSRWALATRIEAPLLREVAARTIGALVLVLGFYLVLRVCGLTRLALTIIGGTGLIGLVIGIAFRDITENFLASVFLSVQRPFRVGDLVEIVGVLGFVQRLTVRTTVLMTLDGNHVQVPNSTVYKSTIRNFTSNPNRREDFVIGIDYNTPIAKAQEVALAALAQHPAVLKDPEPWVLADNLGTSTVNLRVYFWLNGREHSWLKVRSSVIRLVKRSFQEAGIKMPDAEREVIFPRGVPIVRLPDESRPGSANGDREPPAAEPRQAPPAAIAEPIATGAEADLSTESSQIEQQARQSRPPEPGAESAGKSLARHAAAGRQPVAARPVI